jgi:hypothetical protein
LSGEIKPATSDGRGLFFCLAHQFIASVHFTARALVARLAASTLLQWQSARPESL